MGDSATDSEVKAWLKALEVDVFHPTGEVNWDQPVYELLKYGVTLCRLINVIKPGSVGKVHTSKNMDQPSRRFLVIQNLERFIGIVELEMRLPKDDLFDVEAFASGIEEKKVLRTLFVLSDVAVKNFNCKVSIDDVRVKLHRQSMIEKKKKQPMTKDELRERVVGELRTTEHGYITDLIFLIQAYMLPLKQNSELLSPSDFKHMFGNISAIFEFQKNFYRTLSEQTKLPSEEQAIGNCFTENEENFKVYTMYCANHPNAVSVLMKHGDKKDWKAYGEQWQIKFARFFDPAASLIKPIQRILKYPLLLRELLKYTPDTHPDRVDLEKALETMNGVSTFINNMKRKMENLQVMLDLSSRIDKWEGPSFLSCGEMVKDGMLLCNDGKEKRELYFILCEKCLIFCTKKKVRRKFDYDYRGRYSLENLSVCNTDGDGKAFLWLLNINKGNCPFTHVALEDQTWTFYSPTEADKESWISGFSTAIDDFFKVHRTDIKNKRRSARLPPSKTADTKKSLSIDTSAPPANVPANAIKLPTPVLRKSVEEAVVKSSDSSGIGSPAIMTPSVGSPICTPIGTPLSSPKNAHSKRSTFNGSVLVESVIGSVANESAKSSFTRQSHISDTSSLDTSSLLVNVHNESDTTGTGSPSPLNRSSLTSEASKARSSVVFSDKPPSVAEIPPVISNSRPRGPSISDDISLKDLLALMEEVIGNEPLDKTVSIAEVCARRKETEIAEAAEAARVAEAARAAAEPVSITDTALRELDDIMSLLDCSMSAPQPQKSAPVVPVAPPVEEEDDAIPHMFKESVQDLQGVEIRSIPSVYPEPDMGLLLCDYTYVVKNNREYDVQVIMEFLGAIKTSRPSPVTSIIRSGVMENVCLVKPAGDTPETSTVTMNVKVYPANPEIVVDEMQGVKLIREVIHTENTYVTYKIDNTRDTDVIVEVIVKGSEVDMLTFDSAPKSIPPHSIITLGSASGQNIETGWTVKWRK